MSRRTVYYKSIKAAPKVDGRFAEPIKTMIEEHPSLGYRTVACPLGFNTNTALRGVPEAERPSVYLARGSEGLETAAKGSINAEIIERVGARNVAEAGTSGLANVSPEQVQAWAPEVIITIDPDFAAKVGTMPEWQGIPAVKNARVYLAPATPFGFIDRPPSVNRLIGLKWLAQKLYPDRAEGDLKADVAGFYDLFYGVSWMRRR